MLDVSCREFQDSYNDASIKLEAEFNLLTKPRHAAYLVEAEKLLEKSKKPEEVFVSEAQSAFEEVTKHKALYNIQTDQVMKFREE
jgi:hypothetical protein